MGYTSNLIGPGVFEDNKSNDEMTENEFLQKAIGNVNEFFSDWDQNIKHAREDLYFTFVSQWEPELYSKRIQANKPCFEINLIYAVVTSLIGQFRNNTPSYKIHATTDENNPKVKIDQDEVDLRDNLLRQRSYETKIETHFQTAFENALIRGYGALVAYADYESPYSFNQVPMGFAPSDPSWCFWDPSAKEPNKEDSRQWGYREIFTIEEFKKKYPHAESTIEKRKPQTFPLNSMQYENYTKIWRSDDWVGVCHYFCKEPKKIITCQLSDGRSLEKSKALEAIEEHKRMRRKAKSHEKDIMGMLSKIHGTDMSDQESHVDQFDMLTIENERDSVDYQVMHYELCYDEILAVSEWPSKLVNVIFWDGHSYELDGKQYTKSFIHTAKDSQRFHNYVMSEAAQSLLISHKELFLGTPSNFEGLEAVWRDPSKSKGALPANRDETGQLPQVIPPPQISPSYIPLKQESIRDIQATLGYFDSVQGKEGNEKSGVAIESRIKQGNLSSFIYFNNAERAIDRFYKVWLDMMPNLYDNTRDITVRTKSGDVKTTTINQPTVDGIKNDMSKTNFQIEVTVASPYAVQKEENLAQLMQLITIVGQANPPNAMALADLAASNFDLENSPQIVDRIRGLMMGMSPKDILQQELGIKPQPQPPAPPNPALILEQKKLELENRKVDADTQKVQAEAQLEAQKNQLEEFKTHADILIEQLKATAEISRAKEMGNKNHGLGMGSE